MGNEVLKIRDWQKQDGNTWKRSVEENISFKKLNRKFNQTIKDCTSKYPAHPKEWTRDLKNITVPNEERVIIQQGISF